MTAQEVLTRALAEVRAATSCPSRTYADATQHREECEIITAQRGSRRVERDTEQAIDLKELFRRCAVPRSNLVDRPSEVTAQYHVDSQSRESSGDCGLLDLRVGRTQATQ